MEIMKKKDNYTISSGNIFADLELPDAQEMIVKAELARQVNLLIAKKGLPKTAAAKLLEIDQQTISNLSKGKLSGFSQEKLCQFLNILEMKKIILGLSIVFSALCTQEQPVFIVEQALRITLAATDTMGSNQADELARLAFQKVRGGNYGASLALVLDALEKFPSNFILQANLASLLGDYAGSFSDSLRDAMINKSQHIFNKLMDEVEGQHPADVFYFKNEYFFRFRLYKEQYELGLAKIAYYEGTEKWNSVAASCYYTQGVGAAQYARALLIKGDKQLAFDYAQKAVIAWAQHFSYNNSYYNSYVHYALALGILGHKDDMMKALQRSADLIKKDFSFNEFRDVIDFINETSYKEVPFS